MQKVRSYDFLESNLSLLLYKSIQFHFLFHSLSGSFSPFPHGTGSLSKHNFSFNLEGGSSYSNNANIHRSTYYYYLSSRVRGLHPL